MNTGTPLSDTSLQLQNEASLGEGIMAAIEATSQTQAKNPRKAPKSRNGCLRCKSKRVLEPLPGVCGGILGADIAVVEMR